MWIFLDLIWLECFELLEFIRPFISSDWKFLSIISSNKLSGSFSSAAAVGTPQCMHQSPCWWPIHPLGSLHFFFYIFSSCSSDLISTTCLQTHKFPTNPSSKFFSSIIAVFSSKISMFFWKKIYSLCWYFHSMHALFPCFHSIFVLCSLLAHWASLWHLF